MKKIIGIGETVLDVIFKNEQPTAAVPGGSTFNAMISLGRTAAAEFPDVQVYMVTEVGDDHVGGIVTSFMESNGVRSDWVTRYPGGKTPLSLAFLNERNDAEYQFYKDLPKDGLTSADAGKVTFSEGDIVVFGSYFAINPNLRDFVRTLLESAHSAGAVIYYDINFRKNHMNELPGAMAFIEQNCRLSDFVRCSEEDCGYLFGTTDPETVYMQHISQLCRNFICTRGGDPVLVFSGDYRGSFEVPDVKTVSTIGAGDNFNAGFVYGLVSRIEKSPLTELGPDEWGRQIHIASQFSSAVCESIENYVGRDFKVKPQSK